MINPGFIKIRVFAKAAVAALVTLMGSGVASAQLLWRVEGNGLSKPSYIFGTHHMAPVNTIESIKGFNDALDSVDVVYGEVDADEMLSPEMQQTSLAYSMAPSDSTLSKVLTPSQLDSVAAVVKKYTMGMMNMDMVDMLKPQVLANQITVFQTMAAFPDFSARAQLDMTVQNMAKERGKESKGLETMEYQLKLIYGTPIAEQVESLMKSVRYDGELTEMSLKLADLYAKGDIDGLFSLMNDDELGMDDAEAQSLIYNRNEAWASQLSDIMPQTAAFVAVGAGHLPGPHGLLALLREAGYTVTPIE